MRYPASSPCTACPPTRGWSSWRGHLPTKADVPVQLDIPVPPALSVEPAPQSRGWSPCPAWSPCLVYSPWRACPPSQGWSPCLVWCFLNLPDASWWFMMLPDWFWFLLNTPHGAVRGSRQGLFPPRRFLLLNQQLGNDLTWPLSPTYPSWSGESAAAPAAGTSSPRSHRREDGSHWR